MIKLTFNLNLNTKRLSCLIREWIKPLSVLICVPMLFCACSIFGPDKIPSIFYQRDISPRVNQILERMTIEEKTGQLLIVYFNGPSLSFELKEMINEFHVGGIILYAITENIENPVQVANLINAAQKEALTHGAGIPLFVAIDQEGGIVSRLTEGVTVFPGNMAVGATGSLKYARLMAVVIAKELKALGINMNFAPVVDVNNNPDNPIIGIRSFGSSPEQVAGFGEAMINAYKRHGVVPVAKHFPGHGDTAIDSHVGLPIIQHNLNRLKNVELLPFQKAVDVDVPAIMTAHVKVPTLENGEGLPATMSHSILTGLLRCRMGFEGLIITDSLGMGALDKTYGIMNATYMAFQAGADILLFGADKGHEPSEQQLIYKYILSSIRSGHIPIQRLDKSVKRILMTKARYGLLDLTPVNINDIPKIVGIKKHQKIAADISRDSITLIKDDNAFLPIDPQKPALVIWPEKYSALRESFNACNKKLEFFPVSLDPSQEEIDSARSIAEKYSLVVLGTSDAHRHPQQTRLVRALSDKDIIAVALRSPYDIISFPEIACCLATYGTRDVSLNALAKVLFGLERPKGKLPVAIPGLYPN